MRKRQDLSQIQSQIPEGGIFVCLNDSEFSRGLLINHPFHQGEMILIGRESVMHITSFELQFSVVCLWDVREGYIPKFEGWHLLSETVVSVESMGNGNWELTHIEGSKDRVNARAFPDGTFPRNVAMGVKFKRG